MPKQTIRYGYEKTIHGSTVLDIEVDPVSGDVVAVWFRCMHLPFRVSKPDPDRVKEMQRMYGGSIPELLAVDVEYETKA